MSSSESDEQSTEASDNHGRHIVNRQEPPDRSAPGLSASVVRPPDPLDANYRRAPACMASMQLSLCVPVTAYDGRSVLRLLYPAAVQLIACLSVHRQSSLDRCEDYGRDSAPVRPDRCQWFAR